MIKSILRRCVVLTAAAVLVVPAFAGGQFDETPVPAAMQQLDFLVGDWTVEGAFRTPDHVGADRTLWYLTAGGGVTRFDGSTWVAYERGDSAESDAVLDAATRAEPYPFVNDLSVRWIQDGFALLLDAGRTGGSTVIFFDTARERWVSTLCHAPTNAVTVAEAPLADLPVFEGRGADRRGERIFRSRYEIHGPDHLTLRTDVSFDEGVTWIEDQGVQQIRRR